MSRRRQRLRCRAMKSLITGACGFIGSHMTRGRRRRTGRAPCTAQVKRPLLEYDQVQYFGHDFLYSNEKLKQTGFVFEYPEPEPGLRETLRWYGDHGWLPASSRRG